MQFSTIIIIISLTSAGFAAPSSLSNSQSSAAPIRRQDRTSVCIRKADDFFFDCEADLLAAGQSTAICVTDADEVLDDCLAGFIKRDATKRAPVKRDPAKRENQRRFDLDFCNEEADNFFQDCVVTGGDSRSCGIDADSVFNDCLDGFIAKRDSTEREPTKRDPAKRENQRRFDLNFCNEEADNFFQDCVATGGDSRSCGIDADSVFNDCLDGFIAKRENHRRFDFDFCAQESDDFFFNCEADALAAGEDTAFCFSDADLALNDCLNS